MYLFIYQFIYPIVQHTNYKRKQSNKRQKKICRCLTNIIKECLYLLELKTSNALFIQL